MKRQTAPVPRAAAVVVAAGSSRRMGGQEKLFTLLGGEPVLVRALRPLQAADTIERIIIVTRPDRFVLAQDACREFGITKAAEIVAGGETRAHSVLAGVKAAGEAELVAVHDGARPFVTPALVDALVRAAAEHGAAAPGIPVKDTIKVVDGEGHVLATPDRAALRAIQTPQVFRTVLLRAALEQALSQGLSPTDDCGAVEAYGAPVLILPGEERNIKLTTPADFLTADAILNEQS